MSRMMMAARMPIASLAPPTSASAKMSPPNSMRRPGTLDVFGEGLDLLAVRGELLTRAVGEVDLRVRDLAVARDLARALRPSTGSATLDVGDLLLDLVEQALHRLLHLGVVDALLRREHDLRLHLAVAEARLLEEVERLLALGARQLELGLERTAQAARQREGGDEQDDPRAEHPAAAAVHRGRESLQHGGTSQSRGAHTLRGALRARSHADSKCSEGTVATVGAVHGARACRTAGTPERNGPCQWPTSRCTASTGRSASPSWSARTT